MEYGGQAFWLILLTIGVVLLAGAMIYGSMQNRKRTLGERVATEVATKREYEREDHDEQ